MSSKDALIEAIRRLADAGECPDNSLWTDYPEHTDCLDCWLAHLEVSRLSKVSRLQTELEKATADNDTLAEEVIELKAEMKSYTKVMRTRGERLVEATKKLDAYGICPDDLDCKSIDCEKCWLDYIRGDK